MYSNVAKIISLMLIMVYIYKKTKNKIALWALGIVFFCGGGLILFDWVSHSIPKNVLRIIYLGGVFLVPIAAIIAAVLAFMYLEKRKTEKVKAEEFMKGYFQIFQPAKDNIIFWSIIVLINLIVFVLEEWIL